MTVHERILDVTPRARCERGPEFLRSKNEALEAARLSE